MDRRQESALVESLAEIVEQLKIHNKLLNEAIWLLKPVKKPARFIDILINKDGQFRKADHMILDRNTEYEFKVEITDEDGNPARVEGDKLEPIFSGDELAKFDIAGDGMSGKIFTGSGPAGKQLLQLLGDADLGEGKVEIVGEVELELLAKEAKFIKVSLQKVVAPPVEAPVEASV
jgi:hypothetical protein